MPREISENERRKDPHMILMHDYDMHNPPFRKKNEESNKKA